jgi:hypothetical protein
MQTISINVNNDVVGFVKGLGFMSVGDYVSQMFADKMAISKKEEEAWDELYSKLDASHASGYVEVDDKYLIKMKDKFEKIKLAHKTKSA